ncbi:unnamed protein product [Periconia digitata]|uniref:Probable acetate kinase n=1 Tax=Periconia digitata TaxID=1303443 RepID=A0A9W4XVE1_9PLEO|nr:unnamed protein product [Periconia digitata]
MEIILSVNAGSSSVKISVFKAPEDKTTTTPTQLAEAVISGLTAPPASLKYTRGTHRTNSQDLPSITSQEAAFHHILTHLTTDAALPELARTKDIRYVCHRVVHGGNYPRSQVIDSSTLHHIEALSDLAPLHNAPALGIVKAAAEMLPQATNVAFFDTSFHSSIPEHISTYPIDQRVAKKNGLRKYGFHGISYEFITRAVSTYLSIPRTSLNIIALHLGSGASATCIKSGRSHDTSMGLTPLSGLPGATRSGDIDASLPFHFTHDALRPSRSASSSLHLSRAEHILNSDSGWRSLTGTTDFGVISARGREEDELAFRLFVDRIVGFVGSYYVKLGGKVDALVFAGGIGERGERVRRDVVGMVGCLGFGIDEGRNMGVGGVDGVVVDVGGDAGMGRVLVVRTDEQAEMARGVVEGIGRVNEGGRK